MSKSNKFGTFGGVFTPSILTILGVIMYLRLPMIVGEAGLLGALAIIVIAHIISATTGLSVSSIATDKKVEAGGTYYMISRSMGLPIGGTLGLALFVGLSFSVSLYLIGFAESFLRYWEMDVSHNSIRITGTIILVVVTTITFISTSLAIKTQYFIMAAIVLSLVSIFIGAGNHDFPAAPVQFSFPEGASFMLLFGIFFPAVTGFEAGVSMSGDLKDPKKSIPTGSILAIVVGFVVYVGLVFFFSYTVAANTLANDENVLLNISWAGGLVIVGIWGATLSSALGSILGAPRILQATAVDKITPRFFAKGFGRANEPRNALIITFIIAEAGILIGELNAIASIVSIFFITTYGFLNLSCAFEAWTSADFRPSFKTPVWVSLLGAIACIVVMIRLNFIAMLGAIVILGLLFLYLKRQQLTLQSGDAWSGVWASLIKAGLQRLSKTKPAARNWRPNIIMFNGYEKARPYLTELGTSIAGSLGILSSFELVQSENEDLLVKSQRNISEDKSTRFFQHKHTCKNIYAGMDEIARVYGFTGVEPNTILMGWSKNEKHKDDFLKLIRNFERSEYNSLFVTYNTQRKFGEYKTIDIWWSGWGKNLSLAVNLLRHISTTGRWKDARIRLLVVCNDVTLIERTYNDLTRIIDHFRVKMEIKVVNNTVDQLSRIESIARESATTDLTIVGIPDKRYEDLEKTYYEVNELATTLGTALFINASSIFEEYTLGFTDEPPVEAAIHEQVFTLPELSSSRYPVITNDIIKIDVHGRKVLEQFYDKAFLPYFKATNTVHHALYELTGSTASAIENLSDKNQYRKAESLFRIRRHFYTEANKILTAYATEELPEQVKQMEEGLLWYITQLDRDIVRFPKRLTIRYHREDFEPKKSDSGAIRWLKFRKRVFSPFSGEYITGKLLYREIAAHYLRDNRHHFLSVWLEDFYQSTIVNQEKIQSFIGFIDGEFEHLEKSLENENDERWESSGKKFLDRAAFFMEEGNRLARLYEGRLQVEFRRNLQIFSKNLERININSLIKEKRSGEKYYNGLTKKNSSFPQRWVDHLILAVNKTRVSILMRSFRWQILHSLLDFNHRIDRAIKNKILTPLDAMKAKLKESSGDPMVLKKIHKVEWRIQLDILIKEYEEFSEALAGQSRLLPGEIAIPSQENGKSDNDADAVTVPLSKITHHFLETTLLSPLHDKLTKTLEKIKSVVFNINDQLSLASFNVDNVEEDTDRSRAIRTVTSRTIGELEKDEARLKELESEMDEATYKLVSDLFGPLSEYKLVQTTSDFGHLVRGYRSKRVLSRFGKWSKSVREFIRNKALVVLYSRSEGILLAQRLSESNNVRSVNERTLDVVDKVTPDPKILNQLPHYYQNLFSGRSSIGENFWVTRSIEERLVEKALRRYRGGYHGGVLVLGERNSGKTALCRYIADKQFGGNNVFHVFSINEGSVSENDFVRELAKSTGISSDLHGVMNTLPHQSAIVIHDLELWWQRTEDGMNVVRMIIELIAEYSHKCLFIVNMNPFAYELVNALENIHDRFIGIIHCQPFSSMDLKNLIITRHRSSGLTFTFSNKKEEKISELRLARLFNQYFNYSDGNPGVAMSAWLNSIQKVSVKTLTIKPPSPPSSDVFYSIPEEWSVILIQLILHKRMTMDKLKLVCVLEKDEMEEHVSALVRAGLIYERTSRLFVVNPHVEHLIVSVFKRKEWL